MCKKYLEILEFNIRLINGERGTVSYTVVHDDNGEVEYVRWMDPRADVKAIVHDFAAGQSPAAAGFYATGAEAKALYGFLCSAYKKVAVAATAHSNEKVKFYNRHMTKPAGNLFLKVLK